jgi:hypothetical protein
LAVDRALSDDTELTVPRAQVYQRLHETLRSTRRLVEALEQLVDGLEVQSRVQADGRSDEDGSCDDDFQIIKVSTP